MQKHSNASQTHTTSTSEPPVNRRYDHLRLYHDNLSFPQLYLSVYVSGPPEDTWGFSTWLGRAGCIKAESPEKSDFVIFSGGSDVNPDLYGEKPLPCTRFNLERDAADIELYRKCEAERIPMLGICRGAQFLWAMLGGKLYQDVDNHNDGEHEICYLPTKKKYTASSVHHQAVIPSGIPGLRLLGTSSVSMKRETAGNVSVGKASDFEIYTIVPKAIVGIQGHPEYAGFPNYSHLCIEIINDCILNNKNTRYESGYLRVFD